MLYNKNNLMVCDLVSKDDTRPALTSVRFEPDKTVVTDGYRLLMVETPNEVDIKELPSDMTPLKNQTTYISGKIVKTLMKLLPKRSLLPISQHLVITDKTNESITEVAVLNEGALHKQQIKSLDVQWPDYKKILPATEPAQSVTLNAKLLGELLITMSKMGLEYNQVTVEVWPKEPTETHTLKPIKISGKTQQGQQVTALLMPMKP